MAQSSTLLTCRIFVLQRIVVSQVHAEGRAQHAFAFTDV